MTTAWKDVIAEPEYQALTAQQKAAAQAQYFNEVVAPQIQGLANVDAAHEQFYAQYPVGAGGEFASQYRQNEEIAPKGGLDWANGFRQQSEQLEKDNAATEHSLDDVITRKGALYLGASIAAAAAQPEIATPLYSWAVGAGMQSAAALTADATDEAISSHGANWMPKHPIADAAAGPVGELLPVAAGGIDLAGQTAANLTAKATKPAIEAIGNLMDRYPLTRQTAAYLYGKTGWLDSLSDSAATPDAVPVSAEAKRQDRLTAEASLQDEAVKAMNETFTRRYFAQLGDSYMAQPMKVGQYGETSNPAQALYWLRHQTKGYATSILPHPSTVPGYEYLEGVPDVEAHLRADLPWLDDAIQAIDKGGDIDKKWLGQKLEEHNRTMAGKADDVMRQWDKADIADIVSLMKEIPNIDTLVDWEGVTGAAPREQTLKSIREARKMGLRDATKAYAQDTITRIDEEIAEQKYARSVADNSGETGAVTAIGKQIDALNKMRGDLEEYMQTGDLKGSLTNDEEAMFIAAGKLHPEASPGLRIYQRYREIRAAHNALPTEKEPGLFDKAVDKGVDATALLMAHGTWGASLLGRGAAKKALKSVGNGAVRAVKNNVGKVAKRKLARMAERAVQEVKNDD
ncbi:hypothetical protein LSB85_003677 [Salmonella enterica]|nr:hypothetical protein [Salmonella enterica]